MNKPSIHKKVAQRIRASASKGLVFVQSYPDRTALDKMTAASIVSNKAAYKCGHCHTSVVASAGAAPSCVVCGTKTTSVRASVEIAPPKDLSGMTAVECKDCGSVSVLESHVLTASAHHVHCAVCGSENDYNASAKGDITAAMKNVIAAFKLKEFWNPNTKDFSATYKTSKPIAIAQAELVLSGDEDTIGMMTPGGRVLLARMPSAQVQRLKKVDGTGKASRSGMMFPRLAKAAKLAQSYNDPNGHAILFSTAEGTETAFGVAVFTGNIAQASAQSMTAAPKLRFLGEDGDTWGGYDFSGSFSFEQARMLAMETEGSGLVLDVSNKWLLVKPPKNLPYLDSTGNQTKTRATILRPQAIKVAQNYSGAGTVVLIPESPRDFFVCVLPGDVTAGLKITAAPKLNEFLGQDGNWTTYSSAKGYSASMGRSLVLEHEDGALLPMPNGRVLVTKIPGGYSKLRFADMSGAPVAQAQAATFKLHTAMKMADAVTDAKQTGMLVPVGFSDFQVVLFKGGLVQASVDMDADDLDEDLQAAADDCEDDNSCPTTASDEAGEEGDVTTAGDWPFATNDDGAPTDEPVAAAADDDGDGVVSFEDDMSLESDAMPQGDEMPDDLEVELSDLDEVADADEMPAVQAHSEMELPATPDETAQEPVSNGVDFEDDQLEAGLSAVKMTEASEGDDLADVMDMDDTQAGLSFEAKAGRIVAMKGHVAIASLTREGAGQNADIMRSPAFLNATASLARSDGMRKALAAVGFRMIKIPVMTKATVSRQVNLAMQASVNKQAVEAAALSESMAIAAAGLARGRWKGKENPLLAAFAGELSSLGIRNSERVVARILASNLVPFTKTLMEVTAEVNKLSPAARKETASLLEMTTADVVPLDEEASATDPQTELEDRFQTTAAVMRATLPIVASGSKAARRSQVAASAHQTAMAILNGDRPLSLGQ